MSDGNVYFQPFTAPDGSARAPIVERVEACRPRHCDDPECHMVLLLGSGGFDGYAWDIPDSPAKLTERDLLSRAVAPNHSVALCRAAVMAWLAEYGQPLNVYHEDDLWEIELHISDTGGLGNFVCESADENLDEALNMCAHDIADELEKSE